MSWETGFQNTPKGYNLNLHYLDTLKGTLEEKEAKITLAKFLRFNLGFTTELLTGVKLFPFQELILRAWFKRNYNLAVWSRGGSKSWLVAVFCVLYSIFNPGTRFVLVAQNFRTSKRIFEYIIKLTKGKGAVFLRQCFTNEPARRNESWVWDVNEGTITSLPLAQGDKIRGVRADVLIVDEFNLIPEEIFEKVLKPFLQARDVKKAEQNKKIIEDRMIAKGLMKEEDRTKLTSRKKIIGLSSASYTFEYLYKIYTSWIEKIRFPKDNQKITYFVSQLSYDVIPKELMEEDIAEEAKNGGSSNAIFMREFGAQFTDDSDSYFSARKMSLCTIPDNEEPTIELIGEKNAEYVLAIDTNFSSSASSDDFAMAIHKINRLTGTSTHVHSYAMAGVDMGDHVKYVHYILKYFNIVYVIMDKAGAESFLTSCNASSLFKDSKLELNTFAADFDPDKYDESLKEAKKDYNQIAKKIVHLQIFEPKVIRRMNEWLQASIDRKRVLFASHASAHPDVFPRMLDNPIQFLIDWSKDSEGKNQNQSDRDKMSDVIDKQGMLMDLTKKECSLIEIKTDSATGHQRFELPNHLRKSNRIDKPRKDSYTALMLCLWGVRCYLDMDNIKEEEITTTFKPFMG